MRAYPFEEVDLFIEKMLYYYDICGLVAGIGCKDGLLHTKAAGYKNIKTGEKLMPHHIFHMASLTKLFVSTSILQLCDKGLLSLNERLVTYLPWFHLADERFRQITLRDLLSHTAGMPDCEDYEWNRPRTDQDALNDYLKSISNKQLRCDPGSGRFFYSNIGYEALGAVISAVSGVTFEQYVEQNIFLPLEMKDSSLLTFERDQNEICAPHYKDEDKHFQIRAFFPYNRAHAPSSTLTSNVYDLAKFAAAHMGGKGAGFLSREANLHSCAAEGVDTSSLTSDRRFTPLALVPNNGEHIGMGWFIREQNGYTLYGHEGMDDGFRSSFWICPEADLFITITADSDNSPVKKLNKQLFDLLITPEFST